MADPIFFPSTTVNFALPLLFSGQAQKEFTLNQALAAIDALLAGVVEASLDQPPIDPAEGECYRIAAQASGEWADHSDEIAARIGNGWHFVTPREGMEVFDRSLGIRMIFRGQWQSALAPAVPQGGAVIDTEARATLAQLVEVLQQMGTLPAP